jgi:hypothetical protein
MMTRFRTYCRRIWPVLLLAAAPAAAQIAPSGPLRSDPARAGYAPPAKQLAQQRTTALALPFFDDFTSPLEGPPSVQRWLPKGGALVNNRFALLPPTRGTATLDGLRANGQTYSPNITSPNAALDSLISQPIDLSLLNPADAVVLTFAWQAGSMTGIPDQNFGSSPVRLELFVKTDVNLWESKWVAPSTGRITPFRQQIIPLNLAKYLHGAFQFMFVATGNTTTNSDTWSIDYVVLNRNRPLTPVTRDTTYTDVAAGAGLFGQNPSGGLRSPLRRFAAMPVWQYNAATTSELNPALGVNVTNLSVPIPTSVTTTGIVQELPSGNVLGTWLTNQNTIPPYNLQTPRVGSAASVPLPATAVAKRLRYKLYVQSQEAVTSPTIANDTIYRDVELSNYYAYDDGTAERSTNLPPWPNGQQAAYAYRFDLNQPDYVRGLRLYPVFGADIASRPITISVWGDLAGKPGPLLGTKTYTIRYPYPTGWSYYQVDFDQPVPVSTTFYVGFSQPSNSRFLEYAVDRNSTFPAQHFLRRDNTGQWDTLNFEAGRGALMMRPVMTNNVATATAAAQQAAAYGLYPNPAHGTVTITGPAFARATVLDALGRTVWEQPTAQAGQPTLPLPPLPAGVYTVRLTLADGRMVGRRLMLE